MGSLAGGRGWGSSKAEESVVDPEEESVEESLDDSSLEDSPGSLFLFWGGGLEALLGSRLGGRWGLGLGLGAVWGAGWGFGGWGCTGGAHAGGHEATDTGLAYAPVSQAHGHHHSVQCFNKCLAALQR